MELGDKFRVRPEFAAWEDTHHSGTRKLMTGEVVYIHPKNRYAVLEFEGVHGKVREAFFLDQLTEKPSRKARFSRHRTYVPTRQIRPCRHCGGEFVSEAGRKYCSLECSAAAQYKREYASKLRKKQLLSQET